MSLIKRPEAHDEGLDVVALLQGEDNVVARDVNVQVKRVEQQAMVQRVNQQTLGRSRRPRAPCG